jgi:cytidylate kinase
LEKLILGVAAEGNAVIIGRAAYYFLRDAEDCYRFRIVAPIDWRAKYAVEKLGLSPSQAQKVIEKKDKNQAWFRRSACGEDFDSPLFFHLTLNTGIVSLEKAVGIILSVVNE